VAFTVATDGSLLLHVPPASPVVLYSAVVLVQIGELPLTVPAFALGLTVSGAAQEVNGALQPAVTV
jgi:hypothetical protein